MKLFARRKSFKGAQFVALDQPSSLDRKPSTLEIHAPLEWSVTSEQVLVKPVDAPVYSPAVIRPETPTNAVPLTQKRSGIRTMMDLAFRTRSHNKSIDTSSTASETTEEEYRIRPVLITVAPKASQIFSERQPPQYSPDMLSSDSEVKAPAGLKEDSKVVPPGHRQLFAFDDYDAASLVGSNDVEDSTIGDYYGESTMGESYFGASTVGESTAFYSAGDSTVFGSVGGDTTATLLEDSFDSEQEFRSKLPKELPTVVQDLAMGLSYLMEDVTMCGAQAFQGAEDAVCGPDGQRVNKAWRRVRRGRSQTKRR